MLKRCSKCGEDRSPTDFNKCSSNKDGLQHNCKPCKAQYRKENRDRISEVEKRRYEANREAIKERHKRRYEEKRDEILEKNKQYYRENRDRFSEWQRSYNQENRERVAETTKRRYERNKAAAFARAAKRRADKLQRSSLLRPGDQDKIKAIYAEAKRLTEETGIVHHVDHIVPLRGETCSGLHVPCNLRVVPAQLNLSKGAKIDYELVPNAFRLEEFS